MYFARVQLWLKIGPSCVQKPFSWIIFHQLVDKKNYNWNAFEEIWIQISHLTLGYLNPALNNSALYPHSHPQVTWPSDKKTDKIVC